MLWTLFSLMKNSLSSPSRAASRNSSVPVAENRNTAIVPIQLCCWHPALKMYSLNNHIIYFCKRSEEHLQNALFLLINVCKYNRKHCEKLSNENNPFASRYYTEAFRPSFSSHSVGVWVFAGSILEKVILP